MNRIAWIRERVAWHAEKRFPDSERVLTMTELQKAYWGKCNGAVIALAKTMQDLSKAFNEESFAVGDIDDLICQTVNLEMLAERLRRIVTAYSALPVVIDAAREFFKEFPEGK